MASDVGRSKDTGKLLQLTILLWQVPEKDVDIDR